MSETTAIAKANHKLAKKNGWNRTIQRTKKDCLKHQRGDVKQRLYGSCFETNHPCQTGIETFNKPPYKTSLRRPLETENKKSIYYKGQSNNINGPPGKKKKKKTDASIVRDMRSETRLPRNKQLRHTAAMLNEATSWRVGWLLKKKPLGNHGWMGLFFLGGCPFFESYPSWWNTPYGLPVSQKK